MPSTATGSRPWVSDMRFSCWSTACKLALLPAADITDERLEELLVDEKDARLQVLREAKAAWMELSGIGRQLQQLDARPKQYEVSRLVANAVARAHMVAEDSPEEEMDSLDAIARSLVREAMQGANDDIACILDERHQVKSAELEGRLTLTSEAMQGWMQLHRHHLEMEHRLWSSYAANLQVERMTVESKSSRTLTAMLQECCTEILKTATTIAIDEAFADLRDEAVHSKAPAAVNVAAVTPAPSVGSDQPRVKRQLKESLGKHSMLLEQVEFQSVAPSSKPDAKTGRRLQIARRTKQAPAASSALQAARSLHMKLEAVKKTMVTQEGFADDMHLPAIGTPFAVAQHCFECS